MDIKEDIEMNNPKDIVKEFNSGEESELEDNGINNNIINKIYLMILKYQ